jgi:hypothetical protein
MKRTLVVAACLTLLLVVSMHAAGADPGGTVPISGGSPELSFTDGSLTVTGFAAKDGQLGLEGTLRGQLSGLGVAAEVSDLPVQLPLDAPTVTCEPPQVTVATVTTTVPIPGFDPITLDSVTLTRTIDPADTSTVEQACQAADDLAKHANKLKGKRLADAVEALNALGGTWEAIPAQTPQAQLTD